MTTLLTGLLAFVGVVFLAVLGSVWVITRRLRRFGSRFGVRVLSWRQSFRAPGPARDSVRLRKQLQAEMLLTQQMLSAAPEGVVFRADARELLADLRTVATDLDRDLRCVERFADPSHQQAALDPLRPQVEQLISASYSARQTIIRTAVEDRRHQLDSLSSRVAVQAQAADRYRHFTDELSL
jgi:hypothetical protein